MVGSLAARRQFANPTHERCVSVNFRPVEGDQPAPFTFFFVPSRLSVKIRSRWSTGTKILTRRHEGAKKKEELGGGDYALPGVKVAYLFMFADVSAESGASP